MKTPSSIMRKRFTLHFNIVEPKFGNLILLNGFHINIQYCLAGESAKRVASENAIEFLVNTTH
jgi:hypothetical protein